MSLCGSSHLITCRGTPYKKLVLADGYRAMNEREAIKVLIEF
jgi:hypothetical protein